MISLSLSSVKRALVLAAHCDDVEIGCYGLISQLVKNGTAVDAIILSGSLERQEEQLKSFEDWKAITNYSIGHFSDGLFPTEVAEIKTFIRQHSANEEYDLIIAHCRDDHHQDHFTVANLAYNIFRDHWILEYEVAKYDVDTIQPNIFIGMTREQMEAKCRHLEHHFESQSSKAWYSSETFKGLGRLRGIQCNNEFAEAFICRKALIGI